MLNKIEKVTIVNRFAVTRPTLTCYKTKSTHDGWTSFAETETRND